MKFKSNHSEDAFRFLVEEENIKIEERTIERIASLSEDAAACGVDFDFMDFLLPDQMAVKKCEEMEAFIRRAERKRRIQKNS